jgi:hypothetical protein
MCLCSYVVKALCPYLPNEICETVCFTISCPKAPIMRSFLFCLSLSILAACSPSISKLSVTYKFPEKISDSLVVPFSMTFYVIHYKDIVVYELPVRMQSWVNNGVTRVNNVLQVESTLSGDTTKFDRVAFYKGDKWGCLFKVADSTVKKVNIDSILTSRAILKMNINIDETILPAAKHPSEIEQLGGGMFRKRYTFMGYDSLNFYFNNKLRDIPYIISGKLDSAYHSKVYRMEIVTPKNELTPEGGMISLEVVKEEVKDKKELKEFFKRFRKQLF